MSPVRIALFLCDTPIDAVIATDGDYTSIFDALFRASLPPHAPDYVIDPYDVRNKQQYPDNADIYDAIVLTGSAASAYENLDWINRLVSYTRSIIHDKPHIKLIGICFGHQIIARAAGTECVPNNGQWEVGITELALTPLGQKLLEVPSVNIEQMHRDHVPQVPPGFHLLGSTPVTPNQGMVKFAAEDAADGGVEDVRVFTVQGHPEFTRRIVDTLVDARGASGAMDAQVVEDARRRAAWRNDGVSVLGKAIWRVILGRR